MDYSIQEAGQLVIHMEKIQLYVHFKQYTQTHLQTDLRLTWENINLENS